MGTTSNFLIGQENWDSKVPLKIILAKSEITTIDDPPALYVQGARMGYLHFLASEALIYFRHVLPPGKDTPWFESKGVPLRWQTPLGVLFDLMTSREDKPLVLTIHFRSYPTEKLLPWRDPESLRAVYLNSLKEAAYICAGSAASVMSMASTSQDELWKSIRDNNFGQYYKISESMDIHSGKQERRRRDIPLRLFIKKGRDLLESGVAWSYTSRPVAALKDDLSHKSLGEALESILPEYFDTGSSTGDNSNIGETASVSATGAAAAPREEPLTLAAAGSREDDGQQWLIIGKSGQQGLQIDGKHVDVWVAGTRPRLDVRLAWLHLQLHHPDHFLYIVLHVY